MNEDFIKRQIEIRKKENLLCDETQSLLSDMIESADEKTLKNLRGYEIEVFCHIVGVNKDNKSFYVDYDGDDEILYIEELSQVVQKEIIDYMLL